MVVNPDGKLKQCARDFDVSQPWLSVIINSDIFKARLAERREAHFANISRTVSEKVSGVANLALNELEKRLDESADFLPYDTVLETAEMALKASGYGAKSGGGTQVHLQVINGGVNRETLEESRALMHRLTITHEPAEEEQEDRCSILPPAS